MHDSSVQQANIVIKQAGSSSKHGHAEAAGRSIFHSKEDGLHQSEMRAVHRRVRPDASLRRSFALLRMTAKGGSAWPDGSLSDKARSFNMSGCSVA